MEIVSVQGSKSKSIIKPGQTRELGRANGFNSSDRTISRRQVSFFNPSHNHNQETRLQFEVIGKNPIFVNKNNEVKVFRRFERGEMESGDVFCVSAKNPIWYTLRKVKNGGESVVENVLESEFARSLEGGFEFDGVEDLQQEGVDFWIIDHVKEFGFVVMGHEFDSYPKKMIREIKNWDWFLEEQCEGSDDDKDKRNKVKGSGKRKRKRGEENDDDWTGESEDDKELINKSRKTQKAKYMTRSKNRGKPSKDKINCKSTTGKGNRNTDEEDMEDEDEDDEMLGGFIVDDENLEDEQIGDEEEEEEELVDEDEDE